MAAWKHARCFITSLGSRQFVSKGLRSLDDLAGFSDHVCGRWIFSRCQQPIRQQMTIHAAVSLRASANPNLSRMRSYIVSLASVNDARRIVNRNELCSHFDSRHFGFSVRSRGICQLTSSDKSMTFCWLRFRTVRRGDWEMKHSHASPQPQALVSRLWIQGERCPRSLVRLSRSLSQLLRHLSGL